jgi:peptidyl-dipeptidase Dcp
MNPLLQPSSLKHEALPFDRIRPEHFKPALEQAIASGRRIVAELKSQPPSFDNTIRALEASTEEMEFVFTVFHNLVSAESNEELQRLSLELGPLVAAFGNDILLDAEVFAKVKEVHAGRKAAGLDPEQLYLVEKTYLDFARSGAGADDKTKARLREIDDRLSRLHPSFRDNVLKATNAFELWVEREEDLAGLSPALRSAAAEAASEKGQAGKWLFTLHHPSYFPFITFAARRELREKIVRAFGARAFGDAHDNSKVVLEIAALSREKAALLGYKSYAEYALELRMAETPAQVTAFLERLLKAAKPAAERELREIQALAGEMDGVKRLEAWDVWYYGERLKEKRYAFDEEQLRPYFKLENVLKGVFEVAGRLYNLDFKPSREYPVYHEDVQVFEVSKKDGAFIGLFYADFFPRPGKSQGAWMTNYREQGVFRGRLGRPHVSIVCNFTKPSAGRPSLLTFDEVRTLFHEFGHSLHSLLSNVRYRTLAGTNVYQDFVELPSQILENWATEEDALKLFAFHYETGDLIPMELVKKLKESQKFMAGYLSMRQLNFAFLDMAWFSETPKSGESVGDFEERATVVTRVLPPAPGTNISASFAHIFGGGYASGYYSYKWAEALDADAFELFQEKGVFDRSTAERFERYVLSKGGSDHPMRLYEGFRGRSPDPEALLRRDGLIG